MSDPFLTLKFAQSLGQQKPLTQIGQGIRGVAQSMGNAVNTWGQAEDQRRQQQMLGHMEQGYNNFFQTYMDDPSAENKATLLKSAQALGKFDETAATIGAVDEQRAAEAEAAYMAELQEDYDEARAEYAMNPTPEGRVEVMDLGSELGIFEDVESMLDSLDEGQLKGLVNNNMAILSAIETGSFNTAFEEIDRQLDALEAAGQGDSRRAEELDNYREMLEEGDLTGARTQLSLMTASAGDFGASAVDNLLELRGDQREQEQHVANVITSLVDAEFKDEERRAEVKEMALRMPNPDLAQLYVDMISTMDKFGDGSGITENQIMNARLAWRKQYLDEIQPFKRIGEQTSIVRQAAWTALGAEGVEGSAQGVADLALVNSFQRLIDDATVRESDITNLKSTIGTVDQMRTMFAGWEEGDILSPLQRRAMLNMADQIRGVFSEQEETTREVIGQNITDLNQRWNDPTALTEESIMGDPLFQMNEERLEQEVRDALIGVWPADKAIIRDMSWEELQEGYSNTLERMGALSGGPPPEPPAPTGTGEPEERP